jgi:hypothetical protein
MISSVPADYLLLGCFLFVISEPSRALVLTCFAGPRQQQRTCSKGTMQSENRSILLTDYIFVCCKRNVFVVFHPAVHMQH